MESILTQFFSVGLIMLFGAMLPGPDFALVTKNTIFHSRRAGLLTSFGISSAIFIHVSYCLLGLGLIIANSTLFFNLIKFLGSAYLLYLGMVTLFSKTSGEMSLEHGKRKKVISDFSAFKQGFLCNLLNPKATLFILALFTLLIKTGPLSIQILYGVEIILITLIWFSTLTFILSYRKIMELLEKSENIIAKLLGVSLIIFGIVLACVKK